MRLLTDAFAFYGQNVSKFALDVWLQACQPFDMEQVSRAFTAHAMDPEKGQFPPRPADLVRVLQGTQTDRALVAWSKAYDAIRMVGAWQSVAFDDGVIHAVIEDLGGWPTFCASKIDDLPFVSRRFCEAYRAYARRPALAYPRWLSGLAESENSLHGQPIAAPLLVGEPIQVHRVIEGGSSGPKTLITQPQDALVTCHPGLGHVDKAASRNPARLTALVPAGAETGSVVHQS